MREYKLAVLFKGRAGEERLLAFDEPPNPLFEQEAKDKAEPIRKAFLWEPTHSSIELSWRLDSNSEWRPLAEWLNEGPRLTGPIKTFGRRKP